MRALSFLLLLPFMFPVTTQAMNFTPSVADVVLEPGESDVLEFYIENTSSQEHEYGVSLYGVTFDDESGEPKFGPMQAEVASWVSVDTYAFSLAPSASRSLELTVAIPASADTTTATFAAVVRESVDDTGMYLSSGVSSLVFVTIGSPSTAAIVTDFRSRPFFAAHLPVTFSVDIANKGERVVQPYGIVRVRDIFGRTMTSLEFNSVLRRVPVGLTRTFDVQWGESLETRNIFHELWRELTSGVGLFTAEFVAAPYPGAEPTLQATTRLLVFPWRIAGIVCGVGTLAYLLFVRKRRRF